MDKIKLKSAGIEGYMKRFILAMFSLYVLQTGPLFPQISIDNPALKLDIPLFDLPYQIDAANTFGNFGKSYINPGMDTALNVTSGIHSAFHYGMKQAKNALGTDALWKKFVYYGGTALGDSLFSILPIPGSFIWMHEAFHSAVLTSAGIPNHIIYDFPKGAATVPDSDDFISVEDYIHTTAAGIESEYLLLEKMQKNNFFYQQDMFNEFLYWWTNYHAWMYAYMPFYYGGFTMTIDGKEAEASPDSLQWVYFLFRGGNVQEHVDAITLSDLTDHEKSFFYSRVMLSLINLASPMMFGIRSIPLGRDTGLYGNFAIRHLYTSFGTDLAVNVYLKKAPYNLAFTYHSYLNYENYFPAIEVELIDFPLNIGNFKMYLSPRLLIGMQPKDQIFKTADPEFLGLLGLRVDFAVTKHFLPYLEFTAKTDGWVAGNEYLKGNVGIKLGISARF